VSLSSIKLIKDCVNEKMNLNQTSQKQHKIPCQRRLFYS